ncbi:hypothetical protein N7467_000776 [Penicillium canescens]|nr:hypothetical protein N7467_000776 [Penicillium canescens]
MNKGPHARSKGKRLTPIGVSKMNLSCKWQKIPGVFHPFSIKVAYSVENWSLTLLAAGPVHITSAFDKRQLILLAHQLYGEAAK